MAARVAWVLNLDADVELAASAGAAAGASRRYTPTRAVAAAARAHAAPLVGTLVAEGDLVVDDATAAGAARGLVGRAFCPTTRARALLKRAGAEPEPAPPMEVLRAVNSRAFAAALGQTLPGAAFVRDLAAARAHLAAPPPAGDAWRMKRAFGMAGRGQRIAARAPREADLAFVAAGLAEGGVQLEPNVPVVAEYGLHGLLSADGRASFGEVVLQTCDARGAWAKTQRLSASERAALADLQARLAAEVHAVAAALSRAGYFGPFGVDAFSYRLPTGALALQPRSEINARYSMGFATGFFGVVSARDGEA